MTIRNLQPVAIASMLLVIASCNNKKTPPANATVNVKFEEDPPIAKEVGIKPLAKPDKDGNTILFTAQLDKEVIKSPFHAIMAGDEKIVLRDDGQGGDEVKGDGVFSVLLKEDLKALRERLSVYQKDRITAFEKGSLIKFVNRRGERITQLEPFNAESLTSDKFLRLPDFFPLFVKDEGTIARSLMITDLSVIQDPARTFNPCNNTGTPNGAWTFERLMRNLTGSSGVSLEDFTRSWLDTWMFNQTVNGEVVPARASGIFNRIIKPWLVKSGTASASITTANWKTKPINLKFAPFRLLAIVNRIDLRGSSGYGGTKGGEGRFVFCAIDLTRCGSTLPFTVIFEYGINKKNCELKKFAKAWLNLRDDEFGTSFNNALEKITNQFAGINTSPSKPNGSSLNQLRTNEIALDGPWELREFKLNRASHLLQQATVTREPQERYNRKGIPAASTANMILLATWANGRSTAILNDSYSVPTTLSSGETFLGGKAHTEGAPPPTHFWDANTSGTGLITNDEVRHLLSLNTCSGCHGGEGATPDFTHVFPAFYGSSPGLSPFLTGKGTDATTADDAAEDDLFFIKDPASRPTPATATLRGFNDLKRRLDDLTSFALIPCDDRIFDMLVTLKRRPLNMTH